MKAAPVATSDPQQPGDLTGAGGAANPADGALAGLFAALLGAATGEASAASDQATPDPQQSSDGSAAPAALATAATALPALTAPVQLLSQSADPAAVQPAATPAAAAAGQPSGNDGAAAAALLADAESAASAKDTAEVAASPATADPNAAAPVAPAAQVTPASAASAADQADLTQLAAVQLDPGVSVADQSTTAQKVSAPAVSSDQAPAQPPSVDAATSAVAAPILTVALPSPSRSQTERKDPQSQDSASESAQPVTQAAAPSPLPTAAAPDKGQNTAPVLPAPAAAVVLPGSTDAAKRGNADTSVQPDNSAAPTDHSAAVEQPVIPVTPQLPQATSLLTAARPMESTVSPAQIPQALQSHIEFLARDGGGQATIRISPPDLGTIDIRVTVNSGHVHAAVSASSGDVARMLQSGSGDLGRSLADRGLQLSSFNVSADASGQGSPQGRGSETQPEAESFSRAAASDSGPDSSEMLTSTPELRADTHAMTGVDLLA